MGTVSMPVEWEQLERIYPTDFTLRNVPGILEQQGDPWAGILEAKQDLAALLEQQTADEPLAEGAAEERTGRLRCGASPALLDASHAGHPHGAAADPGQVGVRAQARRGARADLCQWRNGADLLPQSQTAQRRLSRAGGGAATAVRGDAVLDGEIVAFDPERGVTSFARLQQRMQLRDPVRARRSQVPVHLYLFDCMFYEGMDLTALPLLERKAVLRDVVWYDDPIRFTPHRTTGSAAMLREACDQGAEGIIAKRADSRYVSARSTDWLKIKCVRQQEFVIGGYTAPQGSRERLGALLVGYYDGKSLRYAGKVGTGYDRRTLEHAPPPPGAVSPRHLALLRRAGSRQ